MKKNQFKLASQILVLTSGLLFTFCSPPKEIEKLTFLSKRSIDLEDSLTKYKIEGDAHGGKYFSRADSSNVYGQESVYNIPDSLQQKDIRVKLSSWVRIGDLSTDKKYGFSLEDGANNVINWFQVDFRSHVSETNKWINVMDSITIPGNLINKPGMIVKMYPFNPDGKSHLDCDDIEMSFYKVDKIVEE